MKNKIVSPSLLACNFLKLGEEIERLSDAKDIWLHLDIMDGHFVPNLTFGHEIIKFLSSVTSHPLDAHLMVSNPEFYIDTFKPFGLTNFTFHYEAVSHLSPDKIISLINKAKNFFPSVGISLRPKSPVELLSADILSLVDLILVISVEPGFGGQKFMPDTFDRIAYFNDLRTNYSHRYQIQVDGGISDQNSKQLYDHGADNLVAGSYVFRDGKEYTQRINAMRP